MPCSHLHVPTLNKCDIKDRFCQELGLVSDHFRSHHMKLLLGDSNAEVSCKVLLNLTIRNGNFHSISDDKFLHQRH